MGLATEMVFSRSYRNKIMLKKVLTFLVAGWVMCSTHIYAQELYKYKDEKGKWVFTDKKPVENEAVKKDVETIVYENTEKVTIKPKVYTATRDGTYHIVVKNPYYAPIEVILKSESFKGGVFKAVAPANSKEIIKSSTTPFSKYKYRWRLGDPGAKHSNFRYQFPASSKKKFRISQSFNGKFSHFRQPNVHSVDVAMEIGTNISAARSGIVIATKDDYHMGGQDKFFLDKANYVKVLHEDGTYAVYAHILLGSAKVKPGDKVEMGDVLARSGTSGYSTGPHLHFVIRKNSDGKTVSVPFKFSDNKGSSFIPKRGMHVKGVISKN